MRRALTAGGLFVFAAAACGRDAAATHDESAETARQAIIAAPEEYTGEDLGEKELALTFDDGPGPIGVTGELAEYLAKRPTPIQATFFVNGACIKATALPNDSCSAPIAGADAVLTKVRSLGHWIGNHTTTHRDMSTLTGPQVLADITETDTSIAKHLVFNRTFFRAPYGAWDTVDFNGVKDSPMKKYVGPVYWTAGGGPTNANRAADWECWEGTNGGGQNKLSTRACGDRYLNEIKTAFPKKNGIVLFHDAKGDTANHDLDKVPGNTVDLIKYLIPKLEADGYKFKTLADVPKLKAVLPACADTDCLECSGAGAKTCLVCAPGKTVTDGACAMAPVDAGADASEPDAAASSSSSSSSSSTSSTSSSSGAAPAPPATAAPSGEDGCNATGTSSGGVGAALVALALAFSLRGKRRRA